MVVANPTPATDSEDVVPEAATARPPYEGILEEMTYEELEDLLGVPGRQKVRVGEGERAMAVYEWRLDEAGVVVTGTFKNDRLSSWETTAIVAIDAAVEISVDDKASEGGGTQPTSPILDPGTGQRTPVLPDASGFGRSVPVRPR